MKHLKLVALLAALCFAATANADTVTYKYKYGFSTEDNTRWQVATLITAGDDTGYTNPSKNNGRYNNLDEATLWDDNLRKTFEELEEKDWSIAFDGERGDWEPDKENWIGAVNGGESKVLNGVYAFNYTLSIPDNADEEVLYGKLTLALASDDYIAAILINGVEKYNAELQNGHEVIASWTGNFNQVFEIDLSSGVSEINVTFIVHNTNFAGSDFKDGAYVSNPMGLYVSGTLETTVEIPEGEPLDNTPEPATMLIIGLGTLGAGFAARRRVKK